MKLFADFAVIRVVHIINTSMYTSIEIVLSGEGDEWVR
jgi:hypothetical protein